MLAIRSLVPHASLYIWKFSVHVLLKLSLKDFKHFLASKWDECKCMRGWTFFEIVFLLDWLKTDLFLYCGHCFLQIDDILNAADLKLHSLGCFKQLSSNSITSTSCVCSEASWAPLDFMLQYIWLYKSDTSIIPIPNFWQFFTDALGILATSS